jgi:hypothetical protein
VLSIVPSNHVCSRRHARLPTKDNGVVIVTVGRRALSAAYAPAVMHQRTKRNDFRISSEKKYVNTDILHDMLSRSYWAKGRSRADVEKSVEKIHYASVS